MSYLQFWPQRLVNTFPPLDPHTPIVGFTTVATLNTPISECGKLVKVILNSFTLLVPPKDLRSKTRKHHLGTWQYSLKISALDMKVPALGTNR